MHKQSFLPLPSPRRDATHPMRFCGGFLLWLCAVWFSSCTPSTEHHLGLKLQGLDAAVLARMRFLDIAIFPASKVPCNRVNATNYTKSGAFAADHLGEFPIRFEGTDRRAIINELPEGSDLVLYFIGLESVGEEKKPLAQGCVSGITLKKGEITVVNVTMNAL